MQIAIVALMTLLYVGLVVYALSLMTRLVAAVERIAQRLDAGGHEPPRLDA